MCVAFLREEVSGVVSISPLILNLLRRLFAHACDATSLAFLGFLQPMTAFRDSESFGDRSRTAKNLA